MSYSLWDTDSANLVGSYQTEAEALEVVADLASRYRSRRGKRLDWLSLHGPNGTGGFAVIANGPELVARALGREAASSASAPARRKAAAA